MNSRILLIAFATISYLSVSNSAQIQPTTKDVEPHPTTQPNKVPSSPLPPIHSETVSQIPTDSVSQVPQKILKPEIIQSNNTNVKKEDYNTTTTAEPTGTTTKNPPKPTDPTTSTSLSTKPSSTTTVSTTTATTNATTVPTSSKATTASQPTKPETPSTTASTGGIESTTPRGIPGPGRQFDGPSFIGGIVLTVGLTAIGFIAFKFYKAGKLDMNYRTL